MADISFALLASLAGLALTAVCWFSYWRVYRRFAALATLNVSQKRLLTYQLLAIALWTGAAIVLFLFAVWRGPDLTMFFNPSGSWIWVIAAFNWGLWGFVAVTSLGAGVTVANSLRSWTGDGPATGSTARLIGAGLLVLLTAWSGMMLFGWPAGH